MGFVVILPFLSAVCLGTAYVTTENSIDKIVKCEFADRRFGYSERDLYTCEIFKESIDRTGYTIDFTNKSVIIEGLSLNYNKNARYLPVNISQEFPDLVEISASFCKIRKITKENFYGLAKIKAINLSKNELQTIDDDTFSDLASLEWLGLDTNLIRVMDGNVIMGLTVLKHLFLAQNLCIDADFHYEVAIDAIEALNFKCSREHTEHTETANQLEQVTHELRVCEAERDDFKNILINTYRHRF